MVDRVGLAGGHADVDAVAVLARQRVGQVAFGPATRHPDRLWRVVRAGEDAALLKVGHRSRVVPGAHERRLYDGGRDAHVGRNVVIVKRRAGRLADVAEQAALPLVDVVAQRTRHSAPTDRVLRSEGVQVVDDVASRACCALVHRVLRNGRHDVVVIKVKALVAELHEPAACPRGV